MRIGCLKIPALPLQALLRGEPSLHGEVVAVARGEGARAQIVGVSTLARSRGVREGQRVKEARALAPELILRWEDPASLASAREAALDAAASVSPKVEEAAPGVVWIDASGLERLHGGERGVASALLIAARGVGLEGTAAIASGKRIAAIAAAQGEGIEVVPKGEERGFLAPLSLAALGGEAALLETLSRWGVSTASELAALPSEGVASRLGPEGVRLHRLASGLDEDPLVPSPAPEVFEEGCELDHELVAMEGLLFLLRPVLERLVERLSCRSYSCGGLHLRLSLDPKGEAHLPVGVAAPTKDVPTLLSICRSALERTPPSAPIRGVRIRAEARGGRVEQLRLFGLPSISPDDLATAVAKVSAIVGDDRVGSPLPADSHRDELFFLDRFSPPPPPAEEEEREAATLGLVLFRPPLPAEVQMAGGVPQALRAGGVAGWVVSLAGPWRVDVGWQGTPLRRDGFDVELSDGATYRLAHEARGGWLLVGRYD